MNSSRRPHAGKIAYLRSTVRRYPLHATTIAGLFGFMAGEGTKTLAFQWLLAFTGRIAAREALILVMEKVGASRERHYNANHKRNCSSAARFPSRASAHEQ
jgi:hypothetical protein